LTNSKISSFNLGMLLFVIVFADAIGFTYLSRVFHQKWLFTVAEYIFLIAGAAAFLVGIWRFFCRTGFYISLISQFFEK
jgi:hypothetical protein